jgi:zinc/manganese transport system permease protein
MVTAAAGDVSLSWNLLQDVHQLFVYPFMVNAFRAGTIVAVLAGVVGWFMVLRRQSFAGHTLAVVGFPGASGAVLLGLSATVGFFAFAIAAALVIASLSRGAVAGFSEESAVVGTIQALALASGYLFISLYGGFLTGVNSLLFGTFLGITDAQVLVLLLVAVVALVTLAVMGRPLFFASVEPTVAAARGVPVRALSVAFLLLLALAAAEVAQITGTLLVFALLVVPAATAQALTANPRRGLVLTVVIGLLITWLGLATAYYSPYPIGFFVTTFGFLAFLGARSIQRVRS